MSEPQTETPEAPAEPATPAPGEPGGPPESAPQPDTPAEPAAPAEGAAQQIHDSIVDEADKLVKAIEGIFEDTNLRGEIATAKNSLKALLARLEGHKQQVQGSTPTEGQAA